jgi:hypothetical protein
VYEVERERERKKEDETNKEAKGFKVFIYFEATNDERVEGELMSEEAPNERERERERARAVNESDGEGLRECDERLADQLTHNNRK